MKNVSINTPIFLLLYVAVGYLTNNRLQTKYRTSEEEEDQEIIKVKVYADNINWSNILCKLKVST